MGSFKERISFLEDTVGFQVSLFARTAAYIFIPIGFIVSLLPSIFTMLSVQDTLFILGVAAGIISCGAFLLICEVQENWRDRLDD